MVSTPFEMGGKSPRVSKESLTGRCFVSAIGPDGMRTTSTISEKPMPSLEGLTGYIVFETHGGSDVEEKRAKRSKQQQQLHDDMLSAIFKSVFEDTVPDSAVGIYSSGEKDRMGCLIAKVIEFRSLPVPVQDNLMRAEILPNHVAKV